MPIYLSHFANRFSARAYRCEGKFAQSQASISEKAYAVICLYSEWEEFSKNLLRTCAHLKPVTTSGVTLSRAPGIRSEVDFLDQLAKFCSKKPGHSFTVAWGAPSKFTRLASDFQLHNKHTLVAAIASSTSPADNLRIFRNFLAHRNPGTALQVCRLLPHASLTTEEVITWLDMRLPGGRTRFGVWCEDLSDIARACTR